MRRGQGILIVLFSVAVLSHAAVGAEPLPPIVSGQPEVPAAQPSGPVFRRLEPLTSPTAVDQPLPRHTGVEPLPMPEPTSTTPTLPTLPAAGPVGFPSQDMARAAGLSSPFSADNLQDAAGVEATYDRVLDLFPDGNDRQLIQRVRQAVEQTEVGVDTTDQQWITVQGDGQRITWGGRLETDAVNWANDREFGGEPNYVEFRRLRLMAAGEGYGMYDYQLELEFTPELTGERAAGITAQNFGVEIKDAYIGLRDVPVIGYTMIGHFRTPIGLESLTSTRFLPFMERSLPTRLQPGRELGLAAFNYARSLNMTWGYGVFFDELDETERSIIDDNQGTRFIGRVTFTPWYDEATGAHLLHTGFGYAYTRPRLRDDPDEMLPPMRLVQFAARPEIHQGTRLISTGDIDTQQYHLLNLELAWADGPLTVQSEGTYVELDRAQGGTQHVWGSYVYGSWFLTGERRPYDRQFAVFRRVIPYENFWLVSTPRGTQAGLGAWEVAARWSYLNFVNVTDQYLHDLTVGLNWYWNPHTRLMVNWIHPFAHNSPVGIETNSQGDIVAARLQIDF